MKILRWLALIGVLIAVSGMPQYAHLANCRCEGQTHDSDHCVICQTLAILKTLVFVVSLSLTAAIYPILSVCLPKRVNILYIPIESSLARGPPLYTS